MSNPYDIKKILKVLAGAYEVKTVEDIILETLFDNRPPRVLFDVDNKALYDSNGNRLYCR